MKKTLLSIVLCCISIVGMAQKDVTKFLGILVDGSKIEMTRKLKAKGFTQSPNVENMLIGEFNGLDVEVYIITNKDKVCRIMVCDTNTRDEASIISRFNVLCNQFKKNSKYCSLEDDQQLKVDEDISYEMSAHKKRYEAIFYQMPDTTLANYKDELIDIIYSKYTKEQLDNPSDKVTNDLYKIATDYAIEKLTKKCVWFRIAEHNGEYYIVLYYDNEYNRAHGEDL